MKLDIQVYGLVSRFILSTKLFIPQVDNTSTWEVHQSRFLLASQVNIPPSWPSKYSS